MEIIPILSIVGKSKSGKTTLLENIIRELKTRNYRVATIKHHAHPGFEIDYPGKDTWRHAQAGSDHVIIISPDKIASIRKIDHPPTLDEIAAGIQDIDIILTDGYHRAGKPMIEIIRSERSNTPLCTPEELIAIVSDLDFDIEMPHFKLDEILPLVDFIENKFLKSKQK